VSRVQLAINVSDLESSIAFYSELLSVEPTKVRNGYANFAVDDPPLKLVLIEQTEARGSGVVGALNHLGIEVETREEVAHSAGRLERQGMSTDLRKGTTCCYALQDKVWVDDPDRVPWEIYTVLADVDDGVDDASVLKERGSGFSDSDAAPGHRCC
jgi:catechol 2,3-dioxygenase-like lactoylglutathione lyase family enzyme